jgi:hypothetical protein
MSHRPKLSTIEEWILEDIGTEWRTPASFCDEWGFGGPNWYRVALVLERLASDGRIERKVSGNRRTFRRRSA